ncbi:MAG: flagellar hook-associated protein FlgL [candidate division Zixibacteria bacterium]|nr:flagellar hook-associated protein FlgL [candidate division Zixibacteria bacterium]
MRVSNNMLADRVVFNMQRSLRRFFELQTQMSTGRRINKPSDDPLGTLRDLDYRKELARIEQYRSNVDTGLNWQANYDSALADLGTKMSDAYVLADAMGNDTMDAGEREAAAIQIDDIIESFLQIANSDLGNESIFAGFKTDRNAFDSYSDGIVYRGDYGQIEFDIESSSRLQVNLIGADVFLRDLSILGADADLNIGILGGSLLTSMNNGNGVDLTTGGTPGTIVLSDRNLGIDSTIDISAAVTIDDVINTINAQLTADGINDVTATLGPNNNEIMFDTTASGEISAVTSLGVINDGHGMDMQPGKLVVSDGGGISVEVDLSSAATIGDVITQFNAAMAAAAPPEMANVSIGLNATNTGLEITDANGVPLGLTISEFDTTDSTAADLGIAGAIDPVLTGRDLNPSVSFEITETTGTTAADLGILGTFFNDFSGADLDPILLATTNLSQLNNNNSFAGNEIVIHHGEATRTIDLSDPALVTVQDLLDAVNNSGLDIIASINADARGIQIANNDPTRSLVIEDSDGGRLTKDMGIYGSSDMVGSLIALSNALHSNDADGIRSLIGNMTDSISQLLNSRAKAGARAMRLESTASRLQDSEIGYTQLLANVEDADMSKLITDLATFENNYQASLMAVAKIIQPSLLNFLQ